MSAITCHFENNKLIVRDDYDFLTNRFSSQFAFWGFKNVNNSYIKDIEDDLRFLKTLIKYLDKNDIKYNLTDDAEKVYNRLNKSISNFNQVKKSAKDFKDGAVDSDKLNAYQKFLNENIERKLRDHQVKASYHLNLIKNGANFSVPGSGKTSVILSFYEKLKLNKKVNSLFVVGPSASFGPWQSEFKLTLGRQPSVVILAGGDKNNRISEYYKTPPLSSELYLTTYHTLLNDILYVKSFFSKKYILPYLVLDEAHYIKQLDGNWAGAALEIANLVENRAVLTGTPMPKSYSDIFNLIEFLWPNENPLTENLKTRIMINEGMSNNSENQKILDEHIGPLFYRVRKSELGLMEPAFHDPFQVVMNQYERTIYNAVEKKIRDYKFEQYHQNIDIIRRLQRGRIIRLRQAVSYPKLLQTAIDDYSESLIENNELLDLIGNYDAYEEPAKVTKLKETVEYLLSENQKILIWAHFIDTLKMISESLFDKGINNKLIYGDVPFVKLPESESETREEIVTEFLDTSRGLNVLIANPAAAAESISLHKTCQHAIYYDLSYNCAQYLQSLDRIHRVGGSENKQANYYFLQYGNTFENDIKNNIDEKARKMYEVIEKDYSIYSLDMFEEDDSEIEAYNRIFNK